MILKSILSRKAACFLFENAYFSYLLYLVDIMNLYLGRDYGAFSEETIKNLKLWYELMLRCFSVCLEREKYESIK